MLILQITAGILLAQVIKFVCVVLFKATVKTIKDNMQPSKRDVIEALKNKT
jgi:hypothetical protein